MNDQAPPKPRLGEIGLSNYAPYLMNRIMGRYNASLRDEMADLGLTTPKMRVLAVLSVIEAPLIRDLAVYTVIEQSTLSRTLDQLDTARLDWLFGLFPALKTFWLHPAGKLSGGQKQMLAIARAMVEPRRLLLIEGPHD